MVKPSLTRLPIGAFHDLNERLGKTILVGDQEIAVFKLSNGRIRAIENRCPHKGGVLAEGMISGDFVFCPMHDWKISLEDGRVQDPDTGCVKSYQVEIEGDEMFLLVD